MTITKIRGYWLRRGCNLPLKSLKEMQCEIQTEHICPSRIKTNGISENHKGRGVIGMGDWFMGSKTADMNDGEKVKR